jgi:hypothetical protein
MAEGGMTGSGARCFLSFQLTLAHLHDKSSFAQMPVGFIWISTPFTSRSSLVSKAWSTYYL